MVVKCWWYLVVWGPGGRHRSTPIAHNITFINNNVFIQWRYLVYGQIMNIIVHSYCILSSRTAVMRREQLTRVMEGRRGETANSWSLLLPPPPQTPTQQTARPAVAAPLSPGAPRIFCSPGRRRREMTSSGPRWWKTDRPLGPRLPSTGRPTPTHNRHGAEEALWRGDDQESATRHRSCFTVTNDDYYLKIHDKIDTACCYLPRF